MPVSVSHSIATGPLFPRGRSPELHHFPSAGCFESYSARKNAGRSRPPAKCGAKLVEKEALRRQTAGLSGAACRNSTQSRGPSP